MKLSQYKEDLEKQEKGSPCYLYDGHFDVRRSGTPSFNKEVQEIKSRLYDFAARDIDMNLIMAHWLAEFGVTGWGGVLDEGDRVEYKKNGKLIRTVEIRRGELEYSKKNARAIFLNPAFYNSLNLLLLQHAADYNNYLHDELEKDLEAIKKK